MIANELKSELSHSNSFNILLSQSSHKQASDNVIKILMFPLK